MARNNFSGGIERTSRVRVHRFKLTAQFAQGDINHLAHRAQRVTLRNPAFRRQVTEKAFLMNIRTAHLIQSFCDHSCNAHFTKLRSLSNQNMSFSTAC